MKFSCLFISLWAFFILGASAQEAIKAKDANKYVGQNVTVIGKIRSVAGPGISSSVYWYVATDSVEVGLSVEIPIKVWGKSKIRLYTDNLKGKSVKIYGLILMNHEPYVVVKRRSDIKIFN